MHAGTRRTPGPPVPAFIRRHIRAHARRFAPHPWPAHSGVHPPPYPGTCTPVRAAPLARPFRRSSAAISGLMNAGCGQPVAGGGGDDGQRAATGPAASAQRRQTSVL